MGLLIPLGLRECVRVNKVDGLFLPLSGPEHGTPGVRQEWPLLSQGREKPDHLGSYRFFLFFNFYLCFVYVFLH